MASGTAKATGRDDKEQPTLIDEEEVEIREMELEDLPKVFALGERLFTADKWPALYRTWDEYEVVNYFASDSDTCFVADLGGQVIGFILGTTIEKRRSAWTYGYVVWLGVDTNSGRRGIGSQLFAALQERFIDLGARMLLVDTDARNVQAVDFFKKQGFGHEKKHVYMSMNLTYHPDYKRHRRALGSGRHTGPRANDGPSTRGGHCDDPTS